MIQERTTVNITSDEDSFNCFLLLMYLIFNIQMYRWKAIKDKEAAAALRAMGRSEQKLGLQLFDR